MSLNNLVLNYSWLLVSPWQSQLCIFAVPGTKPLLCNFIFRVLWVRESLQCMGISTLNLYVLYKLGLLSAEFIDMVVAGLIDRLDAMAIASDGKSSWKESTKSDEELYEWLKLEKFSVLNVPFDLPPQLRPCFICSCLSAASPPGYECFNVIVHLRNACRKAQLDTPKCAIIQELANYTKTKH